MRQGMQLLCRSAYGHAVACLELVLLDFEPEIRDMRSHYGCAGGLVNLLHV